MPKIISRSKNISTKTIDLDSVGTEKHFFPKVEQKWSEDQQKRKGYYKWSGYLSPSMKVGWDVCMQELIANAQKFVEFPEDFLRVVKMGNVIHSGFWAEIGKAAMYPIPPKITDVSTRAWYENEYPEVPFTCNVTGYRGIIDRVIDIDGTPAIFDLKKKEIDPKHWGTFAQYRLPDESNYMQVAICINRVRALGYWDVQPKWFGLGYYNMLGDSKKFASKNGVEFWYEYDDEVDDKVQTYLYHAGRARRDALLGVSPQDIKCRYPLCEIHGGRYRG